MSIDYERIFNDDIAVGRFTDGTFLTCENITRNISESHATRIDCGYLGFFCLASDVLSSSYNEVINMKKFLCRNQLLYL